MLVHFWGNKCFVFFSLKVNKKKFATKNQNVHPNCWTILLYSMQQFLNYAKFYQFFLLIENVGSYDSRLLHCAAPPGLWSGVDWRALLKWQNKSMSFFANQYILDFIKWICIFFLIYILSLSKVTSSRYFFFKLVLVKFNNFSFL